MNKIITALLILALTLGQAWPQAALLPDAKQQYFDNVGNPLASGTVTYYTPGSTNKKTTWQNSTETTNNANPVVLDSAGRAVIYGQGSYRQLVKDSAGVTIWDAVTTAYGSSTPAGATGTDTAPVGTVMPWAGFTIPTNWLLAYGQAVSRTTYSNLYTAITVSNATVSCTAGSPTLSGFADTSQFRIGAPVEATCIAPGTIISSISSSSTIVVNNNAASNSTVTAVVFPWGNGNGSTTFNVPDLRGRVPAGADAMGGTSANRLTNAFYGVAANAPATPGGAQSHTMTTSELVSHNHTVNDPGHSHLEQTSTGGGAVTGITGGTGVNVSVASPISTTTVATGLTLSTAGSTTPFTLVQPSMTINYIIKAAPNTSGLGGVISLGGMFGDIICDGSFLCTNQAIGLATQLTGTVLGNVSATTLSPTGITFTQWMDFVCSSSQGALIYRSGSAWTCLAPGVSGQALETQGAGANPIWATIPGTGTVSSVALTAPTAVFTVSGSPITTAGTLSLTFVAQTKNTFFAGPLTGVNATPAFRALSGVDMPLPAAASLGGVNSFTATTSNFLTGLSQMGDFTKAQPAFSDISGLVAMSQGGTNANLVADNGGVVYSTASALTILTHTATANKPLLSGASTTPSWAAITYPTSANSGGIPYFSSSTVMASSAALTANQLIIGGGAGATPATLGALGTVTTVLHGNAGGAPLFAAVSLTADVIGLVPLANGGTNAQLVADNGGVVYSTASALTILTHTATANQPLLSGASTTPSWSAISYPTSATSGGVPYFSSTTAISSSAALSVNSVVFGGGAGAAPTTNLNAYMSTAGILWLGQIGSVTGKVVLSGGTTGQATIQAPASLTPATLFQVPGNNGTNGYVLTTDGAGVTNWTNPSAGGTVTSITPSTGLSGTTITTAGSISIDGATAANFEAGTTNKVLTADIVFTAETATSYSTTTTFNFSNFLNTALTMTGNITTMTCSNAKSGQAGLIKFAQDGTGSRLATNWCTQFKWAGALSGTLSTTANAVDILAYTCTASGYCAVSLLKNVQ